MYSFKNNSIFNSPNDVISISTGDTNQNRVSCNEFEDISNVDNLYAGNNSRTQFLGNRVKGVHNVNYGVIFGSIANDIGNSAKPAGNCFSNIDGHIVTFANQSFNYYYYYYYYDTNEQSCFEPTNSTNYLALPSTVNIDQCDGQVGIFGLIDPDDDGIHGFVPDPESPPFTDGHIPLTQVEYYVSHWIDMVTNGGGDDPRTLEDDSSSNQYPDLPEYLEILDQWIRYAIYRGIDINDYQFIENVLSLLLKWEWQTRLYGVKIYARCI